MFFFSLSFLYLLSRSKKKNEKERVRHIWPMGRYRFEVIF